MRMIVMCLLVLPVFFHPGVPASDAAAAEGRVALVIGNADYEVARLQNPVNDACDMETQLAGLGFQVTRLLNADKRAMERAVDAFSRKLRDAGGVGLFYFAGHGVQVDGFNYLLPVGVDFSSEADVRYNAVNAGWVLGKMKDAENRLNMVFLDACRNNPFIRRFRSAMQGLAPMDAPEGTLVSFAAAPGGVAADGAKRNGVFTGNLLEYMSRPGLEVELMMKQVRAGVKKDTGGLRTPFSLSSLTGNFYFSPPASPSKATAPQAFVLQEKKETSFDPFFESSEQQRQAEARKRQAEAREQEAIAQWQTWQKEREADFDKAKKIDSDSYLSPSQKAGAWQIFADAAAQDNPHSRRDEELRSYAESRIQYWKKTVASANVSTRLREIARDGNFIAYDNGVVLDTTTNLMWAAKDNGENIDWHDAKKECENYRGGGYTDWRLPTQDELLTLYDGNAFRTLLVLPDSVAATC